MSDDRREYTTGYGKPPKASQFQKGQSGNPNGRPKGRKRLETILRDLLEKEINVDDPIEKKMVRKKISECINLRLVSKALKGDTKSIEIIYERIDGKVVNRNMNADGDLDDEDFRNKFFGVEAGESDA